MKEFSVEEILDARTEGTSDLRMFLQQIYSQVVPNSRGERLFGVYTGYERAFRENNSTSYAFYLLLCDCGMNREARRFSDYIGKQFKQKEDGLSDRSKSVLVNRLMPEVLAESFVRGRYHIHVPEKEHQEEKEREAVRKRFLLKYPLHIASTERDFNKRYGVVA